MCARMYGNMSAKRKYNQNLLVEPQGELYSATSFPASCDQRQLNYIFCDTSSIRTQKVCHSISDVHRYNRVSYLTLNMLSIPDNTHYGAS